MKTKKLLTIITIFCLFWAGNICYGQTAEELFPKAVQLEEVKGELEEAIKIYKTIVKDFPNEREIAAKSLIQMGQCYEKLGKQEAENAYNQLINEYSDQVEEFKKAQTLLAALKQPIPKNNSSKLVYTRVWGPISGYGYPNPSTDERYILCSNWDNGNVAIHDMKTGITRDITSDGIWGGELGDQFAMDIIWSPDEKKIAFSWWIDSVGGNDLRTINRDGTDLQILFKANNNWASPWDWSSDGKFILAEKGCRGGSHEMVLINAQDGTVKELITLMETGNGTNWRYCKASFSPDSKYILYNRSQNINEWNGRIPVKSDIYLMNLKNFREIKLIDHPAEDIMPFWSPDGKKVMFLSNRTGTLDLWQADFKDEKIVGEPKLILTKQGELQETLKMTKNGSLYYTKVFSGGGDIYFASMDLKTGKILSAPKIMTPNFEGQNTEPALSPDGKYLAYFSAQGEKGRGIVIRSIESGNERFLPNEFFIWWRQGKPVWTTDGKSILAYKRDSIRSRDKRKLYAIDIETGKHSEFIKCKSNMVFSWSSPPFFSPNGKFIYFTETDGKETFFIQREIKTGIDKILKPGDRYYLISPDGRQIAFVGGDGKKSWIGVFQASSGIETQLLESDEWPNLYSWSPDSKSLFYGKLNGDITELWKISATGGEPVKMELEVKGLKHFGIHPNGKRIVFEKSKDNYFELWKIDNLFTDSN